MIIRYHMTNLYGWDNGRKEIAGMKNAAVAMMMQMYMCERMCMYCAADFPTRSTWEAGR